MNAFPQGCVEQVARDLDALRARKEARLRHPLWSLSAKLDRAFSSFERHPIGAFLVAHGRWPLVIVPILASWAVQEVGTDWNTTRPALLDVAITLGTLLLIAMVLHARYLKRRGKADSTQAGLSAGAALVAAVPAVACSIVLLVALGSVLVSLPQPGALIFLVEPKRLVLLAVNGLVVWAPIGVLLFCRADTRRSLRQLHALGWRRRVAFAFGLLLGIPVALPTMLPHFRVLRMLVYGSD